ncbi:hypothetical protein LTR94_023672 [Friedmanniomyces endolithicus]|nr:hypothetical protein LTR94_023672 [Friedmanniomyces endolithicus]
MTAATDTILITGGTSGIGRALAEKFHAQGHRVIATGRRRALLDTLEETCPGLVGLELDVSDPGAVQSFASDVLRRFPELNVLINNAGISRPERLTGPDVDVELSRSIIQTNILGVIQMTAALLPALQMRPHASVITTTSGLAFVPRAAYPTYCATKAFLHSWILSLRTQLRGTSVEVLELAPPYVQTELAGSHQASDPAAMPLADYVDEALRQAERTGGYDVAYAALNAG